MATASDITGSLTGIVRGLGSAMRNMGLAITAASGIAAGAMGVLSQRAARVNEAFREVDTITSSTASSQERYGDLVSELNTEMGLNADRLEVIQGLYKSVSAGIDEGTESQEAFLKSAARLSVVGRTELKTTVDVLSTAMNAYGQSNMSAERASNSLFATVQFGKTTLEELAPVMGRVIALGSDMDVAIEELGASMAVLTRTGFSSRIAATGLRAVLRGLMKPSQAMQGILRDIALEQNLFAESMKEGGEEARQIAQEYRNVSDSLKEMEEAQKQAREAVEENSLKIQRARLAIQAIEEDRIEQLDDSKTAELARSNSIEELRKKIENYRFEVNEARIQEEEARQKKEDLQSQAEELEQTFKEELATAGDLKGGIGQLVVENEGFVETLTKVRDRAQEQGVAMSDLFDRSRGLQAALALLGDDGEELNEIFGAMKDGGLDDEEIDDLNERFGTTREEIEKLRDGVANVSDDFEDTQGSTQNWRDAVSQLNESLAQLGEIVRESFGEQLVNIADTISGAVDKLESLDETVKNNIGTFAVLATAIGLVLGPMLLFGGQLAIIASAMGSMFIPFVLTSGSLLGVLALGLLRAAEGGDEASSMFETMQGVISGLLGFLRRLRSIFVEEILPGMVIAGQGVIDVFSAVFSELTDDAGEGESLLRQFASAIGDAFAFIGNFLSNNAETFANFIGILADGFINTIIPAVVKLGQKLVNDVFPKIVSFIQSQVIPFVQNLWETFNTQVLPWLVDFIQSELLPRFKEIRDYIMSDIVPAFQSLIDGLIDVGEEFEDIPFQKIIKIAEGDLQELIKSLTELVDETGQFLSENKELIADLIKVAAAIATVVAAAKILVPVFVTIYSTLAVVGAAMASLVAFFSSIFAAVSAASGIIASLKVLFVGLGGGILALLGPIGIAIAAVGILAAMWATDFRGMREVINGTLESFFVFGKTLIRFIAFILGGIFKLTAAFFNLEDGMLTLDVLADSLKLTLSGLMNLLKGTFNAFEALADLLSGLMLIAMGDFEKGSWRLKQSWSALVDAVIQLTLGLGQTLVGLFGATFGTLLAFAVDFVFAIGRILLKLIKIGNKIILKYTEVIISGLVALGKMMWNVTKKAVNGVIKFFQHLWKATKRDAKQAFEGIKSTLGGFIEGLLTSMRKWGQYIIEEFADGIKDGLGAVKDAMDGVMNTIGKYIPDSPSEKGYFSSEGPREKGEEDISGGLADGIEDGEGDIESSMESSMDDLDTDKEFDVGFNVDSEPSEFPDIKSFEEDIQDGFDSESQFDMGSDALGGSDSPFGSGSSTGMGGPQKEVKKFIVDEKAIYFESGAFQGVSDEEIPEMVEDEIDESLEDVIQEMDGAGRVSPR